VSRIALNQACNQAAELPVAWRWGQPLHGRPPRYGLPTAQQNPMPMSIAETNESCARLPTEPTRTKHYIGFAADGLARLIGFGVRPARRCRLQFRTIIFESISWPSGLESARGDESRVRRSDFSDGDALRHCARAFAQARSRVTQTTGELQSLPWHGVDVHFVHPRPGLSSMALRGYVPEKPTTQSEGTNRTCARVRNYLICGCDQA
jgi:hypothetical protein